MSAVSKSQETSSIGVRLRRCINERVVRRCIIATLAVLVALNLGELYRRGHFWGTGAVQIDGMTFYLNPEDECLTQYMLEEGGWEPEETQLILERLKPGDTVIDIGANFGWYTVLASRAVGDDGLVIAFEPEPTNFALLQRNVEANGCRNVRLVQKALSSEPGSITLYLHERNKGMHSALQEVNRDNNSVEVEAVRLDDYLSDHARPVDLVKLDVEGAEGMVLEGMRETLRANPHMSLMLEFAPNRLEKTGYDPERVLGNLTEDGFEIYEINESHALQQVTDIGNLLDRMDRGEQLHTNLLICGSR